MHKFFRLLRSMKMLATNKTRRFLRYAQLIIKHLALELFLFTYRSMRIMRKKLHRYMPVVIAYTKKFSAWVKVQSIRLTKKIFGITKQFILWVAPRAIKYGRTFLIAVDQGMSWVMKKTAISVRFVARKLETTSWGRRSVQWISANYNRIAESSYSKKLSSFVRPHRLKFVGVQVLVVTMIFVFVLGGSFNSFAATNTWAQTDWSGGVGTSTTDQYESASNINFDTNGEITADMGAEWYGEGWEYRKQITIDADQIPGSSALANYPLLVNVTDTDLRSASNGGNVAQTDGGDIMFTDENGLKLDHEIETYTASTGELVAWVRIPELSAANDTDLYMYYGNDTGGLDGQNTERVWNDDYVLVQHLNESSGTFFDSTANNLDGTGTGAITRDISAKIGKGFSTTGGVVGVPDSDLLTFNNNGAGGAEPFSASTWMYMRDVANFTVMGKSSSVDSAREFNIEVNAGVLVFRISAPGGSMTATTGNISAYANQWVYLTATYDASGAAGMSVFINGTLIPTTNTGNRLIGNTTSNFAIGWDGWGPNQTDGLLDETRLATTEFSADWIATEYNNQNNPSAFYDFGSQESRDAEPSWLGDGWEHRSKITIDADQVSGSTDLEDFVFLVNSTHLPWRSESNGGGIVQIDGGDIIFADANGSKLDHEIETYTASTGELVAWVRIPSLSATTDTSIFMYYGNDAGGLEGQNAEGVWDDDYRIVLPLDETSGGFADSTGNNVNGTIDGTISRGVTGKIGSAIGINGAVGNYIVFPDNDSLSFTSGGGVDQPITISTWMRIDNTGTTFDIASKYGTTVADREYYFAALSGGVVRLALVNTAGNALFATTASGALTPYVGQWIHLVGVYNGTKSSPGSISLYINGQPLASGLSSSSYNGMVNTTKTFAAAGRGVGVLDHTTMAAVTRSVDWIATEYANQNAPSAFYSISESAELVSVPFDTGDTGTLVGDVQWIETAPSGSEIKFQIRTASDNAGTPGVWTDWLGPTGTSDYYTNANGNNDINALHEDGADDRWIQYRMVMEFGPGGAAPTLEEISVVYVANSPPDFNPDYPSTGAGGVLGALNPDGTVNIEYSVRDIDTTTGSVTPGFITPSFEYSLDGGNGWSAIPSQYLGVDDTGTQAVDQVNYTVHTAVWSARDHIPDTYTTQAQIRVTADDGEGANNSAQATSSNFILDTAAPSMGSAGVDASVDPAEVTLSCSDDTSIEMRIGLESDLSDGTYEPYAPTFVFNENVEGGDQVYIQCRDAFGNESPIRTIDIPETPANLFYQDISDASNNDYRLFIAWSVIPEPNAGFESYNVYRSEDGTNFALIETITNRSTNYLIDTGLASGITYYYKLTASDEEGSTSSYSSEINDKPDGSGGTDLSPPTVSNISENGLSASGITITWDSNELSNSTVYYQATDIDPGTDPADYSSSQGVPSMVTEHAVSLASLDPGTQYYYLVTSTDPSGNTGIANASGTFATASGPVISSVSASEVFNDQATITWNTDAPADSRVYYSTNSDLSSATQLGNSDLVTNHSVVIPNLTSGETYYFYVSSENGSGSVTEDRNIVNGVVRYYSFSTTSDGAVPLITNVSAALIGETGVTIAWTTNEGATSQVEWGDSASLGTFTTQTNVYTTQHAVTLTGLDNTSRYYYRVISEDRAGNESQDDNNGSTYSFTTLAPSEIIKTRTEINNVYIDNTARPQISNIQVVPLSTRSARVSFRTDKVTTAEVGYGTISPTERSAGDPARYGFEHSVILDDLEIGSTYVYEVRVFDTTENQTFSDVRTFIHQLPTETQELILSENTRELLATLAGATNIDLASDLVQEAFSELASLGIGVGGGASPDDGSGVAPGEFGILNPQFSSIGANQATLTWRTTRPARTVIEIVNLSTNIVNQYSDNSYLSAHEFTIDNLSERTSYTARITAEDENGTTVTSVLLPFSTSVNNAPLVITDVRTNATLIPGRSDKVQTIISWKTNKPATSQVYYDTGLVGETLAQRSSISQNYTTNHVVIVSTFDAGSIYRVRAESVDGSGASIQSEDYSLVTPRSEQNIIDVIFENVEETFGFIGR